MGERTWEVVHSVVAMRAKEMSKRGQERLCRFVERSYDTQVSERAGGSRLVDTNSYQR